MRWQHFELWFGFLGGTTYDITFPDKTDLNADLKSDLEKLFSKTAKSNDVVISEVAGRNALSVKTVELNEKQRNTLNETLEKTYGVDEKILRIRISVLRYRMI